MTTRIIATETASRAAVDSTLGSNALGNWRPDAAGACMAARIIGSCWPVVQPYSRPAPYLLSPLVHRPPKHKDSKDGPGDSTDENALGHRPQHWGREPPNPSSHDSARSCKCKEDDPAVKLWGSRCAFSPGGSATVADDRRRRGHVLYAEDVLTVIAAPGGHDVTVWIRASRDAHDARSSHPTGIISASTHLVERRMAGKQVPDSEWDKFWEVVERIGERNRHFDPEEVERDIAEAIAEVRDELRAEERARKAAATPQT